MNPLIQLLLDRAIGPTPTTPQTPGTPPKIIPTGPGQLTPDSAQRMMDYKRKVLETEMELRREAELKQAKDPTFWSGSLGTPGDQGLGETDEAYYLRNGAGVPGNRWSPKR